MSAVMDFERKLKKSSAYAMVLTVWLLGVCAWGYAGWLTLGGTQAAITKRASEEMEKKVRTLTDSVKKVAKKSTPAIDNDKLKKLFSEQGRNGKNDEVVKVSVSGNRLSVVAKDAVHYEAWINSLLFQFVVKPDLKWQISKLCCGESCGGSLIAEMSPVLK